MPLSTKLEDGNGVLATRCDRERVPAVAPAAASADEQARARDNTPHASPREKRRVPEGRRRRVVMNRLFLEAAKPPEPFQTSGPTSGL